MPRQIWSDGQEIVESDLSNVSARLEVELYDRVLFELRKRQQNGAFGNSFLCSYINATSSQVLAGNGIYIDSTQVDPEPKCRQLSVASNATVTHTAADPSHNRIDLICIQAARANTSSVTRNYKDPTSGNVSPASFNIETDWVSNLQVIAGTPASSPTVPSTPTGWVAIAQVLITSGVGVSGSSAFTDVRPRFKFASSWKKVVTITANTTMDADDETVLCNDNGGSLVYTLLPVASAYDSASGTGKKVTLKKINSSSNTVTVQGAGSDNIDGQNTQVISNQYTSLTLQCDGSQWNLI